MGGESVRVDVAVVAVPESGVGNVKVQGPARSEAWTGMTVCGVSSFAARSATDRLDAESKSPQETVSIVWYTDGHGDELAF